MISSSTAAEKTVDTFAKITCWYVGARVVRLRNHA
jgi:hypothetical protein